MTILNWRRVGIFLGVLLFYGIISVTFYFTSFSGIVLVRDAVELNKYNSQQIVYSESDRKEIDQIVKESNLLKRAKNFNESLSLLNAGLIKFPNSDVLYTYKAGLFYDQNNFTEAEKNWKQAAQLNPTEPLYPTNVGLALTKQNKNYEASEWYRKAYQLRPNTGQLISIVDILWKLNDWDNYDEYLSKLVTDTRKELDQKKIPPSISVYHALHLPFTPAEVQRVATLHAFSLQKKHLDAMRTKFHYHGSDQQNKRIRVGYVSYDLRNHAVGIQIQSLFGMHNRSKFEIFAYNVNPGTRDPYINDNIFKKISNEVEHIVHIGGLDVLEAAKRINEDRIDILIDLGLYTAYSRMDIFCLRPAPIQVAYLGLASTTGASYYDYIIADRFVIPPQYEKFYTEKIVFMPHTYHILDHKQYYKLDWKPPSRASTKLPSNKFLFCNHANSVRINPHIFNIWTNIVKRVPNSALVLKYFNNDTATNLQREAISRGLKVDRNDYENSQLVFLPGASPKDHIPRKSLCDLYLDTHRYNGHSTTADSLWAGIPMVTYPGETMASRAAGSFALSMGLPEMIVSSWKEYEELAVSFATNKQKYQLLHERLEARRENSTLFDTHRWVSNLEKALETMYMTDINGNPPEHIYVKDEVVQMVIK